METFYNRICSFGLLNNNHYYKLHITNIFITPIVVYVSKNAFNWYVRWFARLYGIEIIQPLINQIIYEYFQCNPNTGVFCIEINNELKIQRVHDVPYVNAALYGSKLFSFNRTNTHMNIWDMFKYYLPDISINEIRNSKYPQGVAVVSFQNQMQQYVNICPNEVYSLKSVLSISCSENISSIHLEYLMVRCFILLMHDVDLNDVIEVNYLFDNLSEFELNLVMQYYQQDNILLLYQSMLEHYAYKGDSSLVLYLLSERVNVPVFLLRKFLCC